MIDPRSRLRAAVADSKKRQAYGQVDKSRTHQKNPHDERQT